VNPGVHVSQRAEGHLKLAAFYLSHQKREIRAVITPDIALDAIRKVRELLEFESTYKSAANSRPSRHQCRRLAQDDGNTN
jgi:hypothetical protein